MNKAIASGVNVRAAAESDAKSIVDLHFASVRHYGSKFYPPKTLESWSPTPDERRWDRMRRAITSGTEVFLVAEIGVEICGFGVLYPAEAQLRALYVHPAYGRQGIGSLLLSHLESLAIAKGLRELRLDASVNAEAFYRTREFEVVDRGIHRLSSGVNMQCVRMRKSLGPAEHGRHSTVERNPPGETPGARCSELGPFAFREPPGGDNLSAAMITVQEALMAAVRALGEGQLGRAEALCREVLAREPRQADALHLLGLIAHQAGHREPAVELLQQAANLRPNSHEVHRNLGLALMTIGRLDEAIEALRRSIAVRPLAATYTNLGIALAAKGQAEAAIAAHRQCIAIQPDYAEGHYNLGNALLEKGRLDEAIGAHRRAIALNPRYHEAFANLANAMKFKGQLDEAIDLYHQAIALRPGAAESYYNLGIAFFEKGKVEESIAAYRQAIAAEPRFFKAHCNLGNVLKSKGQLDEAIAAYRQAIASKLDYAEGHSSLGIALLEKGGIDEAIAAHRRAVSLNPNLAEAHNNLANALKAKGELDEAIAGYRRAIELKADYPEAHYNLANALHAKGQLDLAVASSSRALAARPDYIEAHNNLGNVFKDQGDFEHAIAAYEQAIAIKPDFAEAHSNLGTVLQNMGQYDAAIAAFRRAIGFQPDFAKAHLNLAFVLLLQGDFASAWPEYEWRWKCVNGEAFTQPLWSCEELHGRTILLHPEQGFGDTIHMARYLPMVAARGGRVVLECQPELHRLLERLPGVSQVVPKGRPRPAFDRYCPLLSLPRVFGTTLQSIPAEPAYLSADPQLVEAWRQRVSEAGGLKVGLVWAGSAGHLNDKNRSIPLARLSRFREIQGVRFYSLQKGPAAAQAAADPPPLPIADFDPLLTDFAETAALIANLDLVISVDTAVAHLAAALGKPVWLLLPFVPDWRWLLDRDDSPWYPTMRLFRQKAIGDWDEVIERVAEALGLRAQEALSPES
ncbi:MAG TPA: GNAT family N-acetyltransferase [Tepidisphaeraceae bacterium]